MSISDVSADVIMSEIWHMVLHNLADDARASVRLLRAVRDLYMATKNDAKFWAGLETSMRRHPVYGVFSRYIGHLGLRRRILLFSGFCDAPCFGCRAELFGICCNTFATGKKYCSRCKNVYMISEIQLTRRIPIYWIAIMRTQLRHSWMPASAQHKQRFFLRADVNRFLTPMAIEF